MPRSRCLRLAFMFFFSVLFGQQVVAQRSAAQPLDLPKPTRDAQAISVLNRAIAVAGGMETLGAVHDYRATGAVTRHEAGRDIQGLVTLSGGGVAQLRLDENLSSGVRVETMGSANDGVKNEDGTVRKARGPAPFMAGNFALPSRQLITLLKDANLNIIYKGLVQIDGKSAHQIHVQRVLPPTVPNPSGRMSAQLSKDFFIDATNFQVLMIQDTIWPSTPHRTHYSDYRQANGTLAPFVISEETAGKPTRTIHLDSIGFNTGLQKSDFDISAR